MPNRKPLAPIVVLAALLAACASVPPDPALLHPARAAIAEAEATGAARHAPGPFAAARQRLELATAKLNDGDGEGAKRLADQAEMDARVALAQARAEQAEAELAERREALDRLQADLRAAFGDALEDL